MKIEYCMCIRIRHEFDSLLFMSLDAHRISIVCPEAKPHCASQEYLSICFTKLLCLCLCPQKHPVLSGNAP